jgi:hypothetical protein
MANALYPKSKAKFLKAQFDLSSPTLNLRAIAIKLTAGYTYSSGHEFISDLGANIIKRSNFLTGKAVNLTTGAFDSDDPTLQAVTGSDIEAIILAIDTGSDASSPLVMYQDTNISTVPFTPDGSDIRIIVDSTGWFVL